MAGVEVASALNLINKLYGAERDLKGTCDDDRKPAVMN
ncbi:hypothetical protein PSYMO_25879 [Pseudomonas amygdali pv. mori str. 301020]|uniref:Uncharacterized protein n=3 Tax=Pseudomonas syringae group genomosp. 2 TaxID=251698 RepID=A0A3M6F9N8_PSESG|nr:hypothetical protein PSYMO_25879 [Pseudomonas amygdali pv. mori str. 301020]KPB40220.1 Uncharacterized protein AC514_1922 [Pseudomonas savastanoi pv. phaseolicola]KPB66895.1 Uncharacterized protein AC508_3358 [Pseudomonas amygdali pv. mellea]KPB85778.1 Uncharacterized protein AC504_0005 [Pseudomonas syringae pv. maculicola]KPX96462.1 hypothetical protein ALO63_102086 [Pseudomonas amygdali pv. mori]RMM62583.1 hypothetical protein ALQ74_102236 [Pseudomonas savastanoi pv. glycinea]